MNTAPPPRPIIRPAPWQRLGSPLARFFLLRASRVTLPLSITLGVSTALLTAAILLIGCFGLAFFDDPNASLSRYISIFLACLLAPALVAALGILLARRAIRRQRLPLACTALTVPLLLELSTVAWAVHAWRQIPV